jgi:hypothetical protein
MDQETLVRNLNEYLAHGTGRAIRDRLGLFLCACRTCSIDELQGPVLTGPFVIGPIVKRIPQLKWLPDAQ